MKMKHLKSLIEDELAKAIIDLDFHIIVIADAKHEPLLKRLDEGVWKHSGEKDYYYRKDVPKFEWQQLHAHIARGKHINTKSKQVSWNADGSRHDNHTFNTNFNGMEVAKSLARQVLNIPDHLKLESYDQIERGKLILEEVENHPPANKVFIFVLEGPKDRKLLVD